MCTEEQRYITLAQGPSSLNVAETRIDEISFILVEGDTGSGAKYCDIGVYSCKILGTHSWQCSG